MIARASDVSMLPVGVAAMGLAVGALAAVGAESATREVDSDAWPVKHIGLTALAAGGTFGVMSAAAGAMAGVHWPADIRIPNGAAIAQTGGDVLRLAGRTGAIGLGIGLAGGALYAGAHEAF